MSLHMIQIKFTKQFGGGISYYKMNTEQLEAFKKAFAGSDASIQLCAYNGTNHSFLHEAILEISDRPFDPNFRRRA